MSRSYTLDYSKISNVLQSRAQYHHYLTNPQCHCQDISRVCEHPAAGAQISHVGHNVETNVPSFDGSALVLRPVTQLHSPR